MALPGSARLRAWERVGLALVGLLLVAFAGLVELRSCFQTTRKTDFGVYLRAAHAVRTGGDLYQATDNNGYHYTYPPAFAVLLVPFADAPSGQSQVGFVPYSISIALWTLFNFVLVGRIVHVLAKLALPDESPGSRRWWYARTIPVYATLGGLGFSISMGQVNILLAALIVEMLRASLEGKRLQSGLWLAAAIVLKVMPAFLLLYPLLKRDRRAFIGVTIGLTIGLVAIPVAGLGVDGSVSAYQTFANRIILPGATGSVENAAVPELMYLSSVHSRQSFLAVIHSFQHRDRITMPPLASDNTKTAHNGIAAVLTLLAAVVLWKHGWKTPVDTIIGVGVLMVLMVLVNPMSHIHYFALGLPLACGLWLKAMAREPGRLLPPKMLAVLALWMIGTVIPLLPGETFTMLRYHGLAVAASLVLCTAGMKSILQTVDAEAVETPILKFERTTQQIRKAA